LIPFELYFLNLRPSEFSNDLFCVLPLEVQRSALRPISRRSSAW
jgi:hypothetical protein